MKITVTAEHIEHGTKGSCETCPIALAIRQQVKCDGAEVYLDDIDIYRASTDGSDFYTVRTPQVAYEFIKTFDDSGSAEPFEFDLPGLDEWLAK